MKKLCKLVFCVAAFLAAYAFPVDQAVAAACSSNPVITSYTWENCASKCRSFGCCSAYWDSSTNCCFCSALC